MVEWARKAVDAGFRAVKAEVTLAGPYAHTGLREPWERSTEVLAEVRAAIGRETRADGRRPVRVPGCRHCSRRARRLARVRSLLRRDAALARRPRRLPARRDRAADPDRRRRVADHALRAHGPDRARRDPGRAARHRPRRRAHRGQARRRLRRRERGVRIVPHLWKTGHLDRRGCASRRGLAELRLHRVPTRRAVRVADAKGPDQRRASDGRRRRSRCRPSPGLGVELNRDALERYAAEAREVGGGSLV